jgi:hypothetical protein
MQRVLERARAAQLEDVVATVVSLADHLMEEGARFRRGGNERNVEREGVFFEN